uniref:G-protein coupled receptors family 1 profile domain-containing protein n=2 Tax=Strongyloides stercoralis TaxID=6248 RepID=A0AAF5DFA8_STRER
MEMVLKENITNMVSIYYEGPLEQIKGSILSHVFITLVNVIIILITHFNKSFNLKLEIKKIVFLFCYTGLFLDIWFISSQFIFYIIGLQHKKMHILLVDLIEQFYFVMYNIYYITPFCITYWRFILIFFNRTVLLFENIIIAIITMIPSFVAFINCVFFSNIIYSDRTFEYKHYYSDSIFEYMDIFPQVASSFLALILNIMILIKVNISAKKSSDKSFNKKLEVPLTINLLFHSICPLILLVWANMMMFLRATHNSEGEKSNLFLAYAHLGMTYRILSPITMILFMESYRSGFLRWIGCEKKKSFIKVVSSVIQR